MNEEITYRGEIQYWPQQRMFHWVLLRVRGGNLSEVANGLEETLKDAEGALLDAAEAWRHGDTFGTKTYMDEDL